MTLFKPELIYLTFLFHLFFQRSTRVLLSRFLDMKTGSVIADTLCPCIAFSTLLVSIGPLITPYYFIWFITFVTSLIITIEVLSRCKNNRKFKDFAKFSSSNLQKTEVQHDSPKSVTQKYFIRNNVSKEENRPTSSRNVARISTSSAIKDQVLLRRNKQVKVVNNKNVIQTRSKTMSRNKDSHKKRISMNLTTQSKDVVGNSSRTSLGPLRKRSVSMMDLGRVSEESLTEVMVWKSKK